MNDIKYTNYIEDDIISSIITNAYNEKRPLAKNEEELYKELLESKTYDKILNEHNELVKIFKNFSPNENLNEKWKKVLKSWIKKKNIVNNS